MSEINEIISSKRNPKFVFSEEQRQFMLKNRRMAREKLKFILQKKKKEKNIKEEIIVIDDDDNNNTINIKEPNEPIQKLERTEKIDRTSRPNRPNGIRRISRTDRIEKSKEIGNTSERGRPDRPISSIENPEQTERTRRIERTEIARRIERIENSEQTRRTGRNRRTRNPEKSERTEANESQPNIIKDIIDSTLSTNSIPETENRKYRKRKIIYCDYDLSKIVDTRGGFLLEKPEEDYYNDTEKEKRIKHNYAINLDLNKNPKCQECGSLDIDYNYLDNFNVLVCRSCKHRMPEKYSLLTKTECREDYLLTDSELRDRELLPCWERPNPHKSIWNDMMLYVRYQVEEYAFKKWGSEQGLDDEFDRRETEKRQRKEKKFNAKLKELRRNTRTSIWLKEKNQQHVHEFGPTVINKDTGESERRCQTCGYLEEFEEF